MTSLNVARHEGLSKKDSRQGSRSRQGVTREIRARTAEHSNPRNRFRFSCGRIANPGSVSDYESRNLRGRVFRPCNSARWERYT